MGRHDELRVRLDRAGANWRTWRGRKVVADYGDPNKEYHAVRTDGIGLVDRSWRDTLVVAGPDAASWLQGLVTSDLRELVRQGAGQLTTMVNAVGRLIADARVLALPELLMLDLEPELIETEVRAHLERHIFSEDVTILDRSEQTARLALFGRGAAALLQSLATGLSRPVGALEAYEGSWGLIEDMDIVIQHVVLTGGPGYEVSCAAEDAPAIWDLLMATGKLTPVGFETIETLRIEAGVARFGKELSEQRIPLEAGLNSAVSFNKGCYLGQEIIARLDTRGKPARLLRTLVFEGGAAPREGASVLEWVDEAEVYEAEQAQPDKDGPHKEGKKIGEVLSSIWSPMLKKPVALAYIKRGYNEIDTQVSVDTRPATVQPLGYVLASTALSV